MISESTPIELLNSINTRLFFLKAKIKLIVDLNYIDYSTACSLASDLSIANAQMQAVVNKVKLETKFDDQITTTTKSK